MPLDQSGEDLAAIWPPSNRFAREFVKDLLQVIGAEGDSCGEVVAAGAGVPDLCSNCAICVFLLPESLAAVGPPGFQEMLDHVGGKTWGSAVISGKGGESDSDPRKVAGRVRLQGDLNQSIPRGLSGAAEAFSRKNGCAFDWRGSPEGSCAVEGGAASSVIEK